MTVRSAATLAFLAGLFGLLDRAHGQGVDKFDFCSDCIRAANQVRSAHTQTDDSICSTALDACHGHIDDAEHDPQVFDNCLQEIADHHSLQAHDPNDPAQFLQVCQGEQPLPCEGGFEYSENNTYCVACPPGTYSDGAGATNDTCIDAEPGYFVSGFASQNQQPCDPGHSQWEYGQDSCDACSLGTFSNYSSATTCDSCDAGRYADVEGMVECTHCEPGRYNIAGGEMACYDLTEGYYTENGVGEFPAPVGHHADGGGYYVPCPVGHYQDQEGQTDCPICPEGQYTNYEGAERCEDCRADTCSGHGTCQFDLSPYPDTGEVCLCDELWFGGNCNEKQNIMNSVIFGFITAGLCIIFIIPCFCFGMIVSCSRRVRKHRIDRYVEDYKVRYARRHAEMTAIKKEREEAAAAANGDGAQKRSIARRLFDTLATLVLFAIAVVIFVFGDVITMLGNVLLISRNFDAYIPDYDVTERLEETAKALGAILSVIDVRLTVLTDIFADFGTWLANIDWNVIAFEAVEVTCSGSQGPGALLLNLVVVIGVVFLVEVQLYPLMRITLFGFVNLLKDRLSLHGVHNKAGGMILVAIVLGAEGALKYVIQFLAGLMTYGTFFPVYPSSAVCDQEFSDVDSQIAALATLGAYLVLLPGMHLLICSFIPGVPHHEQFEAPKEKFPKCLRMLCCLDVSTSETARVQKVSRSNYRNSITEMPGKPLEKAVTHHADDADGEVPTFGECVMLTMGCKCGTSVDSDRFFIARYGEAMGFKIAHFLKVTFGYWDETVLNIFRIEEKAEKFDEDPDDEDSHHEDMQRILGQQTVLLWFFIPFGVILAKLGEYMNKSAPYIEYDRYRDITVRPFLNTKNGFVAFFKDSRAPVFFFNMCRFAVVLSMAIGPSKVVWAVYTLATLPEKLFFGVSFLLQMDVGLGFFPDIFSSIAALCGSAVAAVPSAAPAPSPSSLQMNAI